MILFFQNAEADRIVLMGILWDVLPGLPEREGGWLKPREFYLGGNWLLEF